MPVFNDEKYLEESINTVINQTLKDIELICVNDGSTDDSIDILCNLKKKHDFIKIYSQYNQGSGKARNNGIEYYRDIQLSLCIRVCPQSVFGFPADRCNDIPVPAGELCCLTGSAGIRLCLLYLTGTFFCCISV